MHGWRPLLISTAFFLTVGCTSFVAQQAAVEPFLRHGDPAQVRERLLARIPIGTPQREAERLVTSFGLELTPESELGFDSHDSINCRHTVRKGMFGQAFWIIQIDCPNGAVSDIICEQIGIEY